MTAPTTPDEATDRDAQERVQRADDEFLAGLA